MFEPFEVLLGQVVGSNVVSVLVYKLAEVLGFFMRKGVECRLRLPDQV